MPPCLGQIAEAATKPTKDRAPDYRLFWDLFNALREGWLPISRCWPKFGMDDAKTTCHNRVDIDWKAVTPPEIWLLARNIFWNVIWYTKYRGPVSVAWHGWDKLRLPPDDLDWEPYVGVGDGVACRRIRSIIAQCALPDSWDDALVTVSEAAVGGSPDSFDLPEALSNRGPMPFVIPGKPLPRALRTLERLLREVNELITYYSERQRECSERRRFTKLL